MVANAGRYDGAPDVQKWTRPVRERGRTLPQGMLTPLSHKHVNHIELLHAITEQNIDLLLEHYIGQEWERLYDELHPEIEPEAEPEIHIAGPSLDL